MDNRSRVQECQCCVDTQICENNLKESIFHDLLKSGSVATATVAPVAADFESVEKVILHFVEPEQMCKITVRWLIRKKGRLEYLPSICATGGGGARYNRDAASPGPLAPTSYASRIVNVSAVNADTRIEALGKAA